MWEKNIVAHDTEACVEIYFNSIYSTRFKGTRFIFSYNIMKSMRKSN